MIKGEHVELRPIARENIDAYLRWFHDPEVTQGLFIHMSPVTREAEQEWYDRMAKDMSNHVFGVHLRSSGELIGNTGLEAINQRNRSANFGIVLGEKEHWGNGHGTDATRTIVGYGFEQLNLHRIELEVFEFNERGIRAYKRVGFKEEGRKRDRVYRDGRYWDAIVMSILEDEWKPAKRTPPRAKARRPARKPGGTRRPKR